MFNRKKAPSNAIESLIGASTVIEGNIRFHGGLRIDGQVRGDVIAEDDVPSVLVLSEQARVIGRVRADNVIVNGSIEGPVQAQELLELQPMARISGQVSYRALEIHPGAIIEGTMAHLEDERPGLKLASKQG
jgi:cytoskeletal protein CcmA (bactofilin family)